METKLSTKKYHVRLHFNGWRGIAGGLPMNKELLRDHLTRKGCDESRIEQILSEINTGGREAEDAIAEAQESTSCAFPRDRDGNIVLPGNYVKRMFMEAAKTLGISTRGNGPKEKGERRAAAGTKHQLQTALWITQDYIVFRDADGTPVEDVEFNEIVGTISGPTGQRSVISRFETLHDVYLEFDIELVTGLPKNVITITEQDIRDMLRLGENGVLLGAKRAHDYGRFQVVSFEEMN